MMRKNTFRTLLTLVLAIVLVLAMTILTSCTGGSSQRYEVAFESNGGTTYYSVRAREGDGIILPVPEKQGYEFVGWYDNSSFSGEMLTHTYYIGSNATLYAKWIPCVGVIKFESNGGTRYADLEFSAQQVQLPTPKKEGFVFVGWYANESLTGEKLGNVIVPTGNMTIYAKWDAIKGSVAFESNGGTKYEKVDSNGQKVQLPTPERDGYHFAGWYDNPSFSGNAYKGEIVPDGAITLYARWEADYVLISLEENGGNDVDDIRLFDYDKLELPTPTRWGYVFKGWYDNASMTGEPISAYFYYPSGDVTLYAKWEKCCYLYLFYGNNSMDWVRFEYSYGDVITLSELYSLLSPEAITVKDYLGDSHVIPFMYWAYQGVDEKSHVKVSSNITIKDDYLILVAQYDKSEVPPAEYLSYDKQKDVYTTTGKVAHQFIDAPAKTPYAYSLDLSFRKGTDGAVGPAFRMRVPNADYHYEGGCDYLSPVLSPSTGSFYIASVLDGDWSYFVNTMSITSLPENWQNKFLNTAMNDIINVTVTIVDYGTYFEVYIDNDLAYTYTNSTKLANYPYTGLGLRSSSNNTKVSGARVNYGYTVSYSTGVSGLTAPSTTWMCGYPELPSLARDNYALEGWYYDAAFTRPVDDRTFSPTGDITLYAKWSTDYKVITFNTNGGSACQSMNYSNGRLYLPTTTRMNYIFTGWYYDEGLTREVDPYNFSISGNITLYAGWRLPYTHIINNGDGSYTYNKKTEAVLGTMPSGIPAQGTYYEFSQTITMTKGAASAGIAFRMNMNQDYTYETTGTDYISVQFAGGAFRISRVKNGGWARLLPNNADYALSKMPQSWINKYNGTADGAQLTVVLTIRDYGTYFEAYVDGELAYTYGANGETTDLTQFTGNGYGIRCSAGTTVIYKDIAAKVITK